MRTAVIILGHGSRQQGAGEPLGALARAVRDEGGYDLVEYAFLQYATPTIPEAVARCVEGGAGSIIFVPFFVQPGAHVLRDIPEQVERLSRRYPGIRFAVTGHVGGHPLMAKIVEDLVKRQM